GQGLADVAAGQAERLSQRRNQGERFSQLHVAEDVGGDEGGQVVGGQFVAAAVGTEAGLGAGGRGGAGGGRDTVVDGLGGGGGVGGVFKVVGPVEVGGRVGVG